ncbi:MAG: Clp1/GlmU family protein [Methanomicrobiaceae archaeon]|nr:Clp1/GlmU family protein [Methanomicrobiaceae archaeon]
MISAPEEWGDLLADLMERGRGVVYVVGATDTGKSTLCRYLVDACAPLRPVAFLDGDTGQSTIGPPSTIGLARYQGSGNEQVSTHLRFAGSTSPRGHFLEFLVGMKRLCERALLTAEITIIDSPGFVEGQAASEFQFHLIDLLSPDHLVAIPRKRELDPVLANFCLRKTLQIHRFPVPKEAVLRSPAERKAVRMKRFAAYFSQACRQKIPLEGLGFHGRMPETFRPAEWRHLLIAFCDPDQLVLALGIVDHLDLAENWLEVLAPPFSREALASVHVGSIRFESLPAD